MEKICELPENLDVSEEAVPELVTGNQRDSFLINFLTSNDSSDDYDNDGETEPQTSSSGHYNRKYFKPKFSAITLMAKK